MRIFLVVIDSFGIGFLPDADLYGDVGANTAVGIGRAVGGVRWPNLQRMGLGNIAKMTGADIPGCPPEDETTAVFTALREKSPGKDTTTGHWEIAGMILEKPFPVFPADFPSFPDELVDAFIDETGLPGILGNMAASGTEIIKRLGARHIETGKPICYTSADSVFQIAAHIDVFPLKDLYALCECARRLCDSYNVGRVIARPFEGSVGNFRRTRDRHDWSIDLPGKSLLDFLRDRGVQTVGIGKIGSIFNEQGIDISYHDGGNKACISRMLELAAKSSERDMFVFVNLVDTDMIYGHRRDPRGYHDAVAQIDLVIPELKRRLGKGDFLLITADHGCDPTFKGTDHTREYVPALLGGIGWESRPASINRISIRDSLADLSATTQVLFGLDPPLGNGVSFPEKFLKQAAL